MEIVGDKSVLTDEPMYGHTSFKVGGLADILVFPQTLSQIIQVTEYCKRKKIPYIMMGNGTNLIVTDKGIRGVVIKLGNTFNRFSVTRNTIEAQAGILLSKLSSIALENGLSGMEFASGIPGTLGGAVVMNAGAYGSEMRDILISTKYLDASGNINTLYNEQHGFGYRKSIFQKNKGIVIKSLIKLEKGNKEQIRETVNKLRKRRNLKQPVELPSAGSVFKRPEGYYAGKLIEDCGLRGCREGGAQVSDKHCGFIVNTGSAKAQDIITLIKHIQEKVNSQFGVVLKTEIRIVGEK